MHGFIRCWNWLAEANDNFFCVLPPDQPWRHWSKFQLVPCLRGVCRAGSRSWTWGGLLEGGSPHRVRKEETHPRPPLPPWPHPSILLPPQKLPCHWPSRQWLSPALDGNLIGGKFTLLQHNCCHQAALPHRPPMSSYQIPSNGVSTIWSQAWSVITYIAKYICLTLLTILILLYFVTSVCTFLGVSLFS